MKIEIELVGTYAADVTIAGRKLRFGYSATTGGWSYGDTITPEELEGTIGGLVASSLTTKLVDILQAWMPENEKPNGDSWEPWDSLSEAAANEVARRIG